MSVRVLLYRPAFFWNILRAKSACVCMCKLVSKRCITAAQLAARSRTRCVGMLGGQSVFLLNEPSGGCRDFLAVSVRDPARPLRASTPTYFKKESKHVTRLSEFDRWKSSGRDRCQISVMSAGSQDGGSCRHECAPKTADILQPA